MVGIILVQEPDCGYTGGSDSFRPPGSGVFRPTGGGTDCGGFRPTGSGGNGGYYPGSGGNKGYRPSGSGGSGDLDQVMILVMEELGVIVLRLILVTLALLAAKKCRVCPVSTSKNTLSLNVEAFPWCCIFDYSILLNK